MGNQDISLTAHLMRRAGFGATRAELEAKVEQGYDATVEELLDTDAPTGLEHDLLWRYHTDHSTGNGMGGMTANWLYRMINSKTPLQEKVSLFWHGVFATGYAKLAQGRPLMDQHRMFREHGMGSLRSLLVQLSKDPSMIIWLDNHDNHKGATNENYARELLELFSMGVGNYSDEDVKVCARAFTGWTVANTEYMDIRAVNDSLWPYGRLNPHYEYRTDDHDDEEITFLGHTGHFSGEDVIDIICQQPATGRFIARQLYSFFVADEPPVPQWPYMEPQDPAAIDMLTKVYFDSGYDIRSMLRALFKSDFFRARESWYSKIKSPADLVAGTLRLTGEFQRPHPKLQTASSTMILMGQTLGNPPSVEGWHEGVEWVDTGNLVTRVNFASSTFGDPGKPGIKDMIVSLEADSEAMASPAHMVQGCLDQMGAVEVSDETRTALVDHASKLVGQAGEDQVAEMLRLVTSTPEFQRA